MTHLYQLMKKRNLMASYYIHMDQGLVVDLRHDILCSGQFSSCAPIVLYNVNTHYCGLYHLGGCDALNEMKTHHLDVLKTVVKPTVVYVLTGLGSYDMATNGLSLSKGHIAPVTNMFPGIATHNNFAGVSTYGSITVQEYYGGLDITNDLNTNHALKTRAAIDNLPDHIGFIGEKDDQALAQWV